jgi:CHAT domain-containing protein/tetratricopeptide (TPR) repeat protein
VIARRALAAAFLALALLRPAGAAEEPAAPRKPRTHRSVAAEFLDAHRKGDEATMAALAADAREWGHLNPYHVAHDLLAADGLDAALSLARRVGDDPRHRTLLAVVEGWGRLDAASLAREVRADGILARVESRVPGDATAREELLALCRLELETATPGLGETILRSAVGVLLVDAGRLEESVAAWKEAAAAAGRVPWPAGVASYHRAAADQARRYGDLAEARARWKEVLDLQEAMGIPAQRRQTLVDIAVALEPFGEIAAAEDHAARAFREAEAAGDRWVAAQALLALAKARAASGEHARALGDLEEARRRFREECSSVLGAAHALAATGTVLARLGLHDRSVESLEAAIAEVETLGKAYAYHAAKFRSDLGRVLADAGRLDRAAEIQERARAEFAAAGHRADAALAEARLGDVLARRGENEPARKALFRAAAELQALGRRPAAAQARADHARVLDRCSPGGGPPLLESARAELETLGDRLGAARADRDLAALARRHGQPEAALRFARRAVEAHLAVGIGLGEEEREGVRREARAAADEGVLAALDLAGDGKTAARAASEAYWFAESGRGLLLAEGIANREALLAAAVPAAVREQDAAARARVIALRDRLAEAASIPETSAESLRAAKAALDAAYRGLEASAARFQREARRAAALVYPRPAPLPAVQATLDEGTALVLYHFAGERAVAVTVLRDAVRLRDLGPAAPIVDAAERYLALVSVEGSRDDRKAAALYDALLRPLESDLLGLERIVIGPDGPLAFLPFEALVRAGDRGPERVLERWSVSYVPSATIRVLLAAERDAAGRRGRGVLALGDPAYGVEAPPAAPRAWGPGTYRPLPGTAAEARAVADLFPAAERTVLLGERATVAGLVGALGRADGRLAVLHVACHGLVDPERPRVAGLVLARGEVLTVDQVHRMRVPADLVVLSACGTGLGRVLHGEGATGLARGFLFAGASGVVVSDWAVSDEATRALVTSFCRRVLRDGLAPREALRAAKVEALRAGGPASHPAHWAAFVLWGD